MKPWHPELANGGKSVQYAFKSFLCPCVSETGLLTGNSKMRSRLEPETTEKPNHIYSMSELLASICDSDGDELARCLLVIMRT